MDFDLAAFLPYRLSLVSNTISRALAKSYQEPHGLSVQEWRIIAVLGRFPNSTATDVIQITAMDKVMVSRAVKRLLECGLIVRTKNTADRRSRLLNLSKSGDNVFRDVVPRILNYEKDLTRHLSVAERGQLDKLLNKLQAIADQS